MFRAFLRSDDRMRQMILLAALACMQPGIGRAQQDRFDDKFLELGAGPSGSAQRSAGDALCDAVNEDRRHTLVRCVPVALSGAMANMQAVASGSIQLGIVRQDVAARSVQDAALRNAADLRLVAWLHETQIGIVTRREAGSTGLPPGPMDMAGAHDPGSNGSEIVSLLAQALGLTRAAGAVGQPAPAESVAEAFCARRIDVVVQAVDHPDALLQKLLACGGVLIDIPATAAANIAGRDPAWAPAIVPAGTYDGQGFAVHTLGVRNLLVTSRAVDDQAICRLAATVHERHRQLRTLPVRADVEPRPIPIPLHAGAARAHAAPQAWLAACQAPSSDALAWP